MISAGVFCREMIGRATELRFLLERVRAGAARSSALVVVRGEAGIGKSRLIEELATAARADGFQIATGSTREFANAPYGAIEEALASLDVRALGPTEDERGDAKTRRFDAVAEGIAQIADASGAGLVVMIEDLHWADAGTLDLLRFLALRLAGRRVGLIATYRHDEIESDSARARAITALEREAEAVVTLDALAADDIDRLLASVIRSHERPVGRDVVAQIRELSDGRPLFAEELLRGVFERIDRSGHAEPSVPSSIRVTVRERFAALPDTDRTTLLHAAVIGRRFSARFVATIAEQDVSAVYGALRRARDLQLVVEQGDEDGDAFTFRHALTREAIYAELLRAEARLLHAKVAHVLALQQPPNVAAIADHLSRAGDADAAAWNERAGDEALAVYAYADAARVYERAHRLTSDHGHRARLAERVAEAWYALGDLPQSVAWFGSAADSEHAGGTPLRAWRFSLRKARVLFESGQYEAGLAEADRLAATSDVEAELRFEADVMVAGLLTSRGKAREALERLRRAELLGAQPEPLVTARFAAAYALALGILGQFEEARQRFEKAIELARAIADNDLMLRTYNNWGTLEIAHGTLERARALYDHALLVADQTKNRRIAAWLTMNAALPALLAGDLHDAHRLLGRSTQIAHGVHVVHRWSLAVTLRLSALEGGDADLAAAQGALDEAIDDLDISALGILAGAIAYQLGSSRRIVEASRVIARVLPVIERIDAPFWVVDAASLYGDAPMRARARALMATAAAETGSLPARGMLALIDARDELRKRRRAESIELAASAVEAFRATGWVLQEAYALELAGRVADALAVFRRIGATAEVRRTTNTQTDTARRRGDATLTGREREIAGMLVAGQSTRAIAETLVISDRTVETHIASIYRKLGVTNRRALETLLAHTASTEALRSTEAQTPYRPG